MNHETQHPGGGSSAPAAAADTPLLRRFQVHLAGAELDRDIDRLAEETRPKMTLPGFRQGKVPLDVVKKVHRQALREEAIQQAIQKLAFARIEADRLAMAGEPYVEKLDDRGPEGFQADIAVEVFPEFELPDLKALRVEVPAASLREEPYDEQRQIERVLEANKRSQPVAERPLAESDLALLQVQSVDAASRRRWPRQKSYFMMNRENASEIAGLYDALLGKKPGESIVLKADYPAEAKKAWAGKSIEHQVEIQAVYEMKKPQLDAELFQALGVKDLEEFKRRLQEEHRRHQQHRRQEALLEAIYEKLLAASDFPVPRALQEQEVARRLTQNRQPLHFASDDEKAKFREALFAQAEKSVRLSLILDKVRERFHLTVGDTDLDPEYARLAEQHGVPEKEIRRYYRDEKKAAELKDHLLQLKVNQVLQETVPVSEV